MGADRSSDSSVGAHGAQSALGAPALFATLAAFAVFASVWLAQSSIAFAQSSLDGDLAAIAKAGPRGEGSDAARDASRRLTERGVSDLPRLFAALDTPNIVAANWVRSAVDEIVDRELARKCPPADWPLVELKAFVRDGERQGRARRLAVDLLERLEPGYRATLLRESLGDREFRDDAVALALSEADAARKAGRNDEALRGYRAAFAQARDGDQVLLSARKLKELGQDADPIRHLGFVTRWRLVGPFDAPGVSGFVAQFAPEKSLAMSPTKPLDFDATYEGQNQARIGWKWHATDDALGQVNLIAAIGPVAEAVGYAHAEIRSAKDQEIQIRCSADDNLTVWLNGEKVLARRQWLNGTRLDRFIVGAKLKAGSNSLLVKICQGPKHVNPEVPNNWTFQLRLCDVTGGGVEFFTNGPNEKSSDTKENAAPNSDAKKK